MDVEQNEFVNRSEITKIVQSLKATDVNFRNYEKIKDKIDSTRKMIVAQIENLTRSYSESKRQFTEKYASKESFKNRGDRGIVELEAFDLMERMSNSVKEAYSWKTLDVELNAIFIDKMFKLLVESKADEVNRDSVRETKTMISSLNEFYVEMVKEIMRSNKEVTEQRMRMLDEKIVSTAKYLQERANDEKKDIINLFSAFVDKYAQESKQIKDMVKNIELKVGRPLDSAIQKDIFEEAESFTPPPKHKKEEPVTQKKMDDIDDNFENFFSDSDDKGDVD